MPNMISPILMILLCPHLSAFMVILLWKPLDILVGLVPMVTPCPIMFQEFQFWILWKVIHKLCDVWCHYLLCKHWILYLSLEEIFNSPKKSCSEIRYFNQQFFMLKHTGKVSVRYRFETKIAEGSKTALKLWETSNLEMAKVFQPSKKYSPFKTHWTDQSRCKV